MRCAVRRFCSARQIVPGLVPAPGMLRPEAARKAAPFTASLNPGGDALVAQVLQHTPSSDSASEATEAVPALFPEQSFTEVTYPFTTSKTLRNCYVHPNGRSLRWGRLLEAIDAMSGDVAHKHALLSGLDAGDFIVVTAAHDGLSTTELDATRDLRLRSYPTTVSRSSMEVRTDIAQVDSSGEEMYVGEVFTVMAARRKTQGEAALQLCVVRTVGADAFARVAQATANQKRRKELVGNALKRRPPTEEEVPLLHEISLNTNIAPHAQMKMRDTELRSVQIMQHNHKNANGKIFGGYLARKAFELAHICAGKFLCDPYPTFLGFDDVYFVKPVNIGDNWETVARVIYASPQHIRVHVEGYVVDYAQEGTTECTNEFHFIFKASDKLEYTEVVPTTYAEGMLYLEGRRRSLPSVDE